MSYFIDQIPNIEGNSKLRKPQKEAYIKIKNHMENNSGRQEVLVVLPTGTGKSGLIAIAPFGVAKGRVLVITPGLVTKKSVVESLDPLDDNFWFKTDVLLNQIDQPTIVEYETDCLYDSLEKADYIIANVHKLQKRSKNSLLNRLPKNFFDMIIVDEAHHSVATTWQTALTFFDCDKIIHMTGTPYRGDGAKIPGKKIHETRLSEVMVDKYVKYLRKQTVNHTDMRFTIPGKAGTFTKQEVLLFKDKEWLEKSVALSEECSREVILKSIECFNEFREASPNVPHKILAAGCSIAHAVDLEKWYAEMGLRTIIIHSKMDKKILDENFQKIERNECDVVVSVNMLMEGYDHIYLSTLALFRPYRSANAFAQIVGRVLRAIPENEITAFDIDNNAIVVFHEETGLDFMWQDFRKEVDRAKKIIKKETVMSEKEYEQRNLKYGDIEIDDSYSGTTDSYLEEFDFSKRFEAARNQQASRSDEHKQDLISAGYSEEDAAIMAEALRKKEAQKEKAEIDELLIQKRPESARSLMRSMLDKNAENAADEIIEINDLDPEGNSLYDIFVSKCNKLKYIDKSGLKNNAILTIYFNDKLYQKYNAIKERNNEQLQLSLSYLDALIEEVKGMNLC